MALAVRGLQLATSSISFRTGELSRYVTGGIGALWTKGVSSVTFGGRDVWRVTEQEFHERGLVGTSGPAFALRSRGASRSVPVQALRFDNPVEGKPQSAARVCGGGVRLVTLLTNFAPMVTRPSTSYATPKPGQNRHAR